MHNGSLLKYWGSLASLMDNPPVPLKSTEVADILEKAPSLLDVEYNELLHYLHQTGRPY
ncbi:hypothetical protein L208DRAFT_1545790 [Tricholoma matsutake]|nr:hypothetical protein L208DRAFT_1545790 [Tricholoma matsutake 945]